MRVKDQTGRIALVTGANRGLGFETCRQLAQCGFHVVLTSRDSRQGVEAVSVLCAEGLDVTHHLLDVTKLEYVAKVHNFVISECGGFASAITPRQTRGANREPSSVNTIHDRLGASLLSASACGTFPPAPMSTPIPPTAVLTNERLASPTPSAESETRIEIIGVPPSGQLYHSTYPGGVTGEEDDITLDDLRSYEQAVGKSATWVYFSHNWYRDRRFPMETVMWIRDAGSIPYIRLMLRSDSEQNHAEPTFTLDRIINGDFDNDLRALVQARSQSGRRRSKAGWSTMDCSQPARREGTCSQKRSAAMR